MITAAITRPPTTQTNVHTSLGHATSLMEIVRFIRISTSYVRVPSTQFALRVPYLRVYCTYVVPTILFSEPHQYYLFLLRTTLCTLP